MARPRTHDGRPLRESVRDTLRARIFDAHYPPGTRLVERDLASEFDVSRLPVREALRMLRQEGLVTERSRGVEVSSLSPEDVADLFDVREALEVLACQLAAERAEPADLTKLEALVRRARNGLKQGSIMDVMDAGSQFHDAITDIARNEFLRTALEPLQGRMHWLLRRARNLPELIDEHDELYLAIASGDPGRAAERSIRHIRKYRSQYYELLHRPASDALLGGPHSARSRQ